jgi:hypothetical protein
MWRNFAALVSPHRGGGLHPLDVLAKLRTSSGFAKFLRLLYLRYMTSELRKSAATLAVRLKDTIKLKIIHKETKI